MQALLFDLPEPKTKARAKRPASKPAPKPAAREPTPRRKPDTGTVILDRVVIELRIAATLDAEVQRDILRRLDESSFARRLIPAVTQTLHGAKMNEVLVQIQR